MKGVIFTESPGIVEEGFSPEMLESVIELCCDKGD